jgi:hypothetical protein
MAITAPHLGRQSSVASKPRAWMFGQCGSKWWQSIPASRSIRVNVPYPPPQSRTGSRSAGPQARIAGMRRDIASQRASSPRSVAVIASQYASPSHHGSSVCANPHSALVVADVVPP